MNESRRGFLETGVGMLGAAALTGPLAFLRTRQAAEAQEGARRPADGPCGTRTRSPYGPVAPKPDQATGLKLLALPEGFEYVSLSWAGDTMDDGNRVPARHDGMAVVQSRGDEIVLIRNHEFFGLGRPIAADHNYDERGRGGTTVLHWKNGKLEGQRVSISGTVGNCAGGSTPWNTWLTCEERVEDGDKPHGYVFESTIERVKNPAPLTAMGRFRHEALALDPRSGEVFLTEDNSADSENPADDPRRHGQSGLFRFVPAKPLGGVGSLAAGGKLYMAQAVDDKGEPVEDLRDPKCFAEYKVRWVLIEEPDSPAVNRASGPYLQGRSKHATRFQRLEGCWWDPIRHVVLFVDTDAGPIGSQADATNRGEGVVWSYDPKSATLKAIFVSQGALHPSAYGADNPDNISVSPRGGILLCEDGGKDDGDGVSLMGLLDDGRTFEFARNIVEVSRTDADALRRAGHDPARIEMGDFSGREWAGATFDPAGRYLFVNIQSPGITFAIRGPWSKGGF
ncbi:MAG: alkaline phosphatase PhoX [Planctomycetaceae bacterium]